MNIISVSTSFIAGILSFLSPCILPLVPAYISYIIGDSINETNTNKKTFFKSLMFVLGFSIVFIFLGATATTISQIFYKYKEILNKIAGVILVILGINLMGIIKIKWLYKINSKFKLTKLKGHSFLIGLAFGLGFTPCVGTILAGILGYASNLDTIALGIMLLSIYSLGLGIPFILTALSVNKIVQILDKIKKYSNIISIISGIMVMMIGILIFTDNLTKINQYFI